MPTDFENELQGNKEHHNLVILFGQKGGDIDNLVARIIKRGDMDNLVAR